MIHLDLLWSELERRHPRLAKALRYVGMGIIMLFVVLDFLAGDET